MMHDSSLDESYFQHQFLEACSQCYILLQKYKLKTNLVSFNMEKEQINYSYDYLEKRITDRYQEIQYQLMEGLKNLHKNFMVAKGNALRTVNNIFCNYRRRVGLLSNDPLSSLKYNKYDKQQRVLLESMLFNQKENRQQIDTLKRALQVDLQQSVNQVDTKYKINDKIKQNFSKAFQVMDKSQCYTYKYYENFQRSMILSLAAYEANFDKLNAFLSIWENVASTKAYEVKNKKEAQNEEKNRDGQRNKRFYEEETQDQLQQSMNSYPLNSQLREEYKKRLNELRRVTAQKQKKLDNFGKMYNKRKNRPGILINRNKDVCVIDYFENNDGQKKQFSHQDEFKHFKAIQSQQILYDYRLTHYELQKPFKTTEEIKNHMQKLHHHPVLNYEWHYDRFGRGGHFNLITTFNQQIQKKIEFQVIRQIELQQNDDRRKRQMVEKNNQYIKENEKKQSIFIGLRRISDKNELEWLNQRIYTPEYIPQLIQSDGEELKFSSDQESLQKQDKIKEIKSDASEPLFDRIANIVQDIEQQINIEELIKLRQTPLIKNPKIETVQEDKTKKIRQKRQQVLLIQQSSSQQEQQEEERGQECLQKQIIQTYFKEYSKKIIRKQTDPYYKKTYFFYYNHYQLIDPLQIAKYTDFENLFIITKYEVILINKIFSNQEKIKCFIYLIESNNEEDKEEPLRELINQIYENTILTVKFQEIYVQDQSEENLSFFIIGLISILVKQNNMPEDFQFDDYILEGKQIIEDFKIYYYPDQYEPEKNKLRKKFKSFAPKDIFAPIKRRQLKRPAQKKDINLSNANNIEQNQSKLENLTTEKTQEKLAGKKEQEQHIGKIIVEQQQLPANLNEKQLKRQNSRQNLASSLIALEITSLKVQQFDDQQQSQDYEAL